MIWHDHRERRTLLNVAASNSFATDFERSIENMDNKLEAFVLDLAAECDPALPLNQPELEYDVSA